MKRRNVQALQEDIKTAKGKRAKAEAYFALGLLHDNRRRAAKAIRNYRKAICYGLPKGRKAHVFAHLGSALWKTGKPRTALGNARIALRLTRDPKLKAWITRLTIRIERAPYRFRPASKDGRIRGSSLPRHVTLEPEHHDRAATPGKAG
jgi:tetratricopeptide (TPR) repeat protein